MDTTAAATPSLYQLAAELGAEPSDVIAFAGITPPADYREPLPADVATTVRDAWSETEGEERTAARAVDVERATWLADA